MVAFDETDFLFDDLLLIDCFPQLATPISSSRTAKSLLLMWIQSQTKLWCQLCSGVRPLFGLKASNKRCEQLEQSEGSSDACLERQATPKTQCYQYVESVVHDGVVAGSLATREMLPSSTFLLPKLPMERGPAHSER